MNDTSKEILRWALLIIGIPIWVPYLRTLWRDFNDALVEDGGVFGRNPVGRELEEARARKAATPDPLVSEPWARAGESRTAKATPRAGRAQSPSAETKGTGFRAANAPRAERPKGFRG